MIANKFFRAFGIIIIIIFLNSCKQDVVWTPLLDKNLSNWDMYLGYRLKDDYKGDIPKDENGLEIKPVGYNKNESYVFSVIDDGGTPVLRISGEIYGCVFTKQDFENYHLKLKVKWGRMKWKPRLDKLMDSGILYDSQGECGIDFWRAWMLGQEFQVMEGHMGDYWSIESSGIEVKAFLPEGDMMNSVASEKRPFLAIGGGSKLAGFCLRSADYESPADQWTELELICFGDKSIHIVNGHVVMVLRNSHFVKDGQSFPLTKGKIQIQSEAAEVFYKDIMIRNLAELPEEYSVYFNSGN
jgi:hypothetical protein